MTELVLVLMSSEDYGLIKGVLGDHRVLLGYTGIVSPTSSVPLYKAPPKNPPSRTEGAGTR